MTLGLAALLAATIASIELLRACGLFVAFRRLSVHGRRSGRLVTRIHVSDWAKERALRLASARMFGLSFAASGRLAIVAAPFALVWVIDRLHPFGLADAWADWPDRLGLLAITAAYAGLRRAIGRGERLFQRIALGSRPVLDISFDIERALHARAAAAHRPVAPVFVAGLARAGTSVLTRALHGGAPFASLSYRDLPFPLAPNSWARMSRGWARAVEAQERGHGDGVIHDLDSPEAIEELFWLAHEGDRYRLGDRIVPVAPRPDTIAAFQDYIRLVLLRYGRPRYLSKNNANILRLPALVEAFPDAHLVHPFRDPLQQAASLRSQHLRACALATTDPFRARFMGWLGHHEFGADHRPMILPAGPEPGVDPTRLDYWLRVWIAAQRFLLNQPTAVRARQIFLDYDAMCRMPARTADSLQAQLGIEAPLRFDGIRSPATHIGAACHPRLLVMAREIHAELVLRSGETRPSEQRAPVPLLAVRAVP